MFTVRPCDGAERKRPSMPAAAADASTAMSKTCAAIHSPRRPDVIGRWMSRASSASIALRSRSSAAARARESASPAGSVPPWYRSARSHTAMSYGTTTERLR